MFLDDKTGYSDKITKVTPRFEYFERNLRTQAPDLQLFFPNFVSDFNIDCMRRSIVAIQKLLITMQESIRNDPFWVATQKVFLQEREVFRYFANNPGNFLQGLYHVSPPEIENDPRRRTIALCSAHDVDGYVLTAKCMKARVKPKNVAVMVLDAHEDMAPSDGKSGAIRALVETHGFGHVIAMGLPNDHAADLYCEESVLDDQLYEEFEVITGLKHSAYRAIRKLPKERFLSMVHTIVEHQDDRDLLLSMMTSSKEFTLVYHSLHESSLIHGKFTTLVYRRNLNRVNSKGKRIEYQGLSVDYEQLERSFIAMKAKGITHLLWSIDVDVFDTMGMRITVPEYTNWWLLAILGLPTYSLSIVNAKRNERWRLLTQYLFYGVGAAIPIDGQELPFAISSNIIARYDGLSLRGCAEYIDRVGALAMKYGIRIGVKANEHGSFYGTFTELPPNSPDYNWNTTQLITDMARFLHNRCGYYNNGGPYAY